MTSALLQRAGSPPSPPSGLTPPLPAVRATRVIQVLRAIRATRSPIPILPPSNWLRSKEKRAIKESRAIKEIKAIPELWVLKVKREIRETPERMQLPTEPIPRHRKTHRAARRWLRL